MKKALRKLIPSIVMMLIAAAFVGTSTYAWFSMNRTVTVTGMSVDTTVSDSLYISASNSEASYENALTQTLSGHLRPVSSVDGVNFFYTASGNVKGDGSTKTVSYTAYTESAALTNTDAGKTAYDAGFNTAYGVSTPDDNTALYGYVDYVFYIKAVNVTNADEALKLTNLTLDYAGTVGTDKAWRVAVFAQAAEKDTALTAAPTASNLKAILTITGAENFEQVSNVNQAAKTASTLDNVTYTTSAWTVDSIAAGQTEYNKITVRLWLEGEDTTCNNETFATLNQSYALSLGFHLGGSETAVTAITLA